MYKIDKDIPIPIRQSLKLWPFKLMEIGDSFWVEGIPRKLQQLLVKQQRRDGRKYRTKAEGIGLRIWRVE